MFIELLLTNLNSFEGKNEQSSKKLHMYSPVEKKPGTTEYRE